MTVYKRSKLTPEMLKQWEREAQYDQIYETAPTLFDLSMIISEKTDGKVDIREDGEIWVDDWPYSCWKKQGDMFVEYMPPYGQMYSSESSNEQGDNSAKIVRGPWK